MRVLLDTSVLVAAMIEGHPDHEKALPWLQQVKAGSDTGIVSAHTLAELYAILTRLPVRPLISPGLARRLIRENVLQTCEIVALSEQDYIALLDHLSGQEIIGGTIYDGLILYAARKVEVDQIVTLNVRDFHRIYPDLIEKVVSP